MIMRKRNKGITLIALIITIVILLILVAVSINLVVNNKLFDSAENAVTETNNKIGQQEKDVNYLMEEWDKINIESDDTTQLSNTDILPETPTSPENSGSGNTGESTGESGEGTTSTIIQFTIEGTSYETENGLSWAEWCVSEYNIDEFYVSGFYVYDSLGRKVFHVNDGQFVEGEDIILEQEDYSYTDSSSSN